MSTLESDGFLSEEAKEGGCKVIDAYKDAFMLSHRSNQEAMNSIQMIHVDREDESRIIVAALYIRVLETYQAIVMLLQMGMVAQARMLVRTGLDALFSMVAIVKTPKLVQSYVAQHYSSVIKALESAKRWKQETLREQLTAKKIDELIANNKTKLNATKGTKHRVWKWAKAAGLDDFYNVFYVENSSAVHSDMWALKDCMSRVPSEKGGIQLYCGPTDIGLYHTLRSATRMLLTGIETITKAYNLPLVEHIKELNDMWLRLDAIYYDES